MSDHADSSGLPADPAADEDQYWDVYFRSAMPDEFLALWAITAMLTVIVGIVVLVLA
ncbi:hypothetical protein [Pseudoclavibacter sp. JSM 162008]|uniref:hypothetical protein n=1 Tax=Pseudoclavibacter sp. JSM 162008 TaxID=3229855 RepID=UPI003524BE9D